MVGVVLLTTLTTTVAILLGKFPGTYGYVLDHSCDNYKSMLLPMLTSAFDLAKGAQRLLDDLPAEQQRGPSWAPEFLAKRMLVQSIMNEIMPNGRADPSNPAWKHVMAVLKKVLAYDKKGNGSPEEPPSLRPPPKDKSDLPYQQPDWGLYANYKSDDLVIFCNQNRFAVDQNCAGNPESDGLCDRTIKRGRQKHENFKLCSESSIPLEAYTTVFIDDKNLVTQIDLCTPWLATMARQKVQVVEDSRQLLCKPPTEYDEWFDSRSHEVPIDLAMDGDGVIFHELTHAIGGKESTAHIETHPGNYWGGVSSLRYGGATKNADSYVYLGIGARLISPKGGQQSMAILADGQVQRLVGIGMGHKRDALPESNCVFTPPQGPPATVTAAHRQTMKGNTICMWTVGSSPSESGRKEGLGQGTKTTKAVPATTSLTTTTHSTHTTVTSPSTTTAAAMTSIVMMSDGHPITVTFQATRTEPTKATSTSGDHIGGATMWWKWVSPTKPKPKPGCEIPFLCPDKDWAPPGIVTYDGKPPPKAFPPGPPPINVPDTNKDKDNNKETHTTCSKTTKTACDSTKVIFKPPKATTWSTITTKPTSCRTETACSPTIKPTMIITTMSCPVETATTCHSITRTMTIAGKAYTSLFPSCQTATGCIPTFTTASTSTTTANKVHPKVFTHSLNKDWMNIQNSVFKALKEATIEDVTWTPQKTDVVTSETKKMATETAASPRTGSHHNLTASHTTSGGAKTTISKDPTKTETVSTIRKPVSTTKTTAMGGSSSQLIKTTASKSSTTTAKQITTHSTTARPDKGPLCVPALGVDRMYFCACSSGTIYVKMPIISGASGGKLCAYTAFTTAPPQPKATTTQEPHTLKDQWGDTVKCSPWSTTHMGLGQPITICNGPMQVVTWAAATASPSCIGETKKKHLDRNKAADIIENRFCPDAVTAMAAQSDGTKGITRQYNNGDPDDMEISIIWERGFDVTVTKDDRVKSLRDDILDHCDPSTRGDTFGKNWFNWKAGGTLRRGPISYSLKPLHTREQPQTGGGGGHGRPQHNVKLNEELGHKGVRVTTRRTNSFYRRRKVTT
ncbi:hypothetical protein QQS21_011515 [Conoideocrella luteorostrata]|uniref:Lysine-specific metallo-endopeptidase domain-containing protein n=1 Tax=Conoideocrella luteorostrata TaxID=1105319 RepID=A0AAJ0CFR6_9HYPO|nr:hypothetical protein QQS21_011515 [Conoideocrella luteorostrata]